ncbi:MAG: phosphoglycerate kinase [Patescibacteria group bacterium]
MRVLTLKDAPDLKGHTVLVRSALNVPIAGGKIAAPFRLEAALHTLQYLVQHGAKVVILSHINGDGVPSLRPVYEYLRTKLPLMFADDVVGDRALAAARGLQNGTALMLENVRRDKREEANDDEFARRLALLGDIFVNDDFTVAHRVHASVVGVPKYLPSYAGLQFEAELSHLTRALEPQSPSIAIIGGAKFVTKEALIRALLPKYDHLFITGALSNDFFKAEGVEVGKSLVSPESHVKDLLKNGKIMLPVDVTVDGPLGRMHKDVDDVLETEAIWDIGPRTLELVASVVRKSNTILWNGPTGKYEAGFTEMTCALAKVVAESKGMSIVGGGDTIAAIETLGRQAEFTFMSTAGGAMLDYLAHGTLPGIEALKNSRKV